MTSTETQARRDAADSFVSSSVIDVDLDTYELVLAYREQQEVERASDFPVGVDLTEEDFEEALRRAFPVLAE